MPESLKKSMAGSKAEYVRLGNSGLKVSIPILGAMSIGHPDWAPWVLDEEKVCCPYSTQINRKLIYTKKSLPLLKAAYDRGVNTWDTANVYSNGVSEEIIGKAIKKYDIPRHKLIILSKCFAAVGEEPGLRSIFYPKEMRASKDYVNQFGRTPPFLFRARL